MVAGGDSRRAPLMLAAALLGRPAVAAAVVAPGRVREALLCEAKQRFETVYGDKSVLDYPKERDNVTLQITRKTYPCGGNNIPMTFGVFEVDDVDPLDLFNVLADTAHQTSWDTLLSGEKELGPVEEQRARGLEQRYDAHPFQDREIFEWQCFNASRDLADLWVAFSTEQNAELHTKADRDSGVVAAQNCLAAYRVQARPGGGAHVTFTTQVNAHPFLVTSGFIFNIMWGKTVDYINALRDQARKLAKERHDAGEEARPAVPDEELYDEEWSSAVCSGPEGGLPALEPGLAAEPGRGG